MPLANEGTKGLLVAGAQPLDELGIGWVCAAPLHLRNVQG